MSIESSPKPAATARQLIRPVAMLIAVAIAVWVVIADRASHEPTPLPADRLLVDSGWADETSCIECHAQAETFWSTGHAQTLTRVDGPRSTELLQQLRETMAVREEGTTIGPPESPHRVENVREGAQSEVELGWCFGSGRHAHTWVGTLTDSYGASDLLEFRWSWYHSTGGFDITPGQPDAMTDDYYGGLGLLFDQPKARRCFGCHAGYVPQQSGRIVEHSIKAGVTCQRCHGPRQAHVDSGGEIHDAFWSEADQLASVRRCAECHRLPDEREPEDIRPDNVEIVRFQPMGLLQSACFRKSEMTCVTCHDPHRPLEAQDSAGIWQCTQCHDGAEPSRTQCAAGHRLDCLRCHMPKVAMDRPLRFTDHWIRVREQDEQQP